MKKPRISEKQIQAAVIEHWRAFGLPNTLVCAVPNAGAFGQPGLHRGVFDLIVIGNGQVRFLELKAEGGKFSKEQAAFRDILMANSIGSGICYGRDDPIQLLEYWGIVRRQQAVAA